MTDIGPKALREMCEEVIDANWHSTGVTVARALLDRLSGEAVTREKLKTTISKAAAAHALLCDDFPDIKPHDGMTILPTL